jgi:hypothetical protein
VVTLAAGTVTVGAGRSEIELEEGYRATVTCVGGEATVRSGEREVVVTAGRAFTVTFGGRPVETEPVRRRWGLEGSR